MRNRKKKKTKEDVTDAVSAKETVADPTKVANKQEIEIMR